MVNKKIILVITKLGGKGWGGAHRVIVILANFFANKGYDTSLIVWEDSEIDYPVSNKVKIFKLNISVNSIIDRIRACIKTRKILKKNQDSYLLALMSRMAVDMLLCSIFLDIKVIGSERTDPNTEPKRKLFRKIRNEMFKYLHKTVYQTEDALNYFPKKARKHGYVIPNPISNSLIPPYFGERNNNFVTFCRIDKQKNLPLMIEAFVEAHKKHPEFKLLIYGTGIIEEEIEQCIRNHDANRYIIMKGFSRNIHELIKKSYAYINSSDYEGMSNSMLESMAIGLPCICTDCPIGGAKEMIKNGKNGILVPTSNEKELTKAIIRLMENRELCDRLSHEASKIRDRLSEEKICEMWENLMID